MRALRSIPLVLVLVVTTSAAFAEAPPPEAKAHFDSGIALYTAGSYDAAIVELEAAIAIADYPDFHYALGQAERKRGRCDRAIEAYRRFLRTSPPPEELRVTGANILRCEEALAKQPAPPPAITPTPPTPPPPPTRTNQQLAGIGVAVTGGVLLGVGTYFAVSARLDWGAVNDAAAGHEPWTPDLQRRYDGAGRETTSAAVLLGLGGAAVITGGLLYFLGAGKPRPSAGPGVAPWASLRLDPAARGAGLGVGCAF